MSENRVMNNQFLNSLTQLQTYIGSNERQYNLTFLALCENWTQVQMPSKYTFLQVRRLFCYGKGTPLY